MSLVSKLTEIVNKAMQTEADKILDELREACPKRTGDTARSFGIMNTNSSYEVGVVGRGVTTSVLIASKKRTAYWADQGNGDSGSVIYPTHKRNAGNKVPMLGKYPNGIPGYGWRAHVNAYEGAGFVKKVADRHR